MIDFDKLDAAVKDLDKAKVVLSSEHFGKDVADVANVLKSVFNTVDVVSKALHANHTDNPANADAVDEEEKDGR